MLNIFILFYKTDKEVIESQDRHQESLKGRITLPACNKSHPDNVSFICIHFHYHITS